MGKIDHQTDVLIIGGGAAGATAAIEAGETGSRVTVLAKGPMTKTGITPLGFTGYSAVTGLDLQDCVDLHFKDTVAAGRYLSDPALVRVMTAGGGESVKKLLQFGVNFQEENGALLLRQAPGMSRPRMLRIPAGGRHLIDVLYRQIKRYQNVKVIPDLVVTDLLQNKTRVTGALAFDLKSGQPFTFCSKATILATGGKGQLWPYTDCPPESTGDGLFLAYRAGAELLDLEQELFYPTVVVHPEHIKGLEISYETFLKPGAKILNRLGENIVPQTDVVPTRDELSNLIFKEIKEGRGAEHGGVLIDLRGTSPSQKQYVKDFLPAYKRLKHFGIEITEELLEVAPAAHTSLGGVRIDSETKTCVEGLFAAGETTGGIHGANRLAGQAWLCCVVFGFLAGKNAAAFARGCSTPTIEPDGLILAETELQNWISPQKGKRRPYQILDEIRRIMWEYVGLRRRKERLEEGLRHLESLRQEVASNLRIDPAQGYNLDRAQALQVRSLLFCAEILTRAALFREESRGTHFREDFPRQDDINWLAHTHISKKGDRMMIRRIPVAPS